MKAPLIEDTIAQGGINNRPAVNVTFNYKVKGLYFHDAYLISNYLVTRSVSLKDSKVSFLLYAAGSGINLSWEPDIEYLLF